MVLSAHMTTKKAHTLSVLFLSQLNGDGGHYREPAKDEHSLYTQFKALNVRLVKKNTIE